jgi:hypothetical protein
MVTIGMRFLLAASAVGLICPGTPDQGLLPIAAQVVAKSIQMQEATEDQEAKGKIMVEAEVALHKLGCEIQWNGRDDGTHDAEPTRPAPAPQFQKQGPAPSPRHTFEPRT